MKISSVLAGALATADGFKIDQPQRGHEISEASTDKPMFCYYTNWTQYRPGAGQFFPEDMPANLCTHIFFSFAYVEQGSAGWGLRPFEWNDQDESWMDGLYTRTNALKRSNPNLKVLLAVGGWNHGNTPFSDMAATEQGRQQFARNALKYVKDHDFDGLDMDWEYPAKCTIDCSPESDYDNFKDLTEKLRTEIDTNPSYRDMLLTTAVGIGKDKIYEVDGAKPSYDVPHLSQHYDWINLMMYDMHGHWEDQTGHQAPAYKHPADDREVAQTTNLEWVIENWIALGADKKKLALGLGSYGRSFSLADMANDHGYLAATGAANEEGLFSGSEGTYSRTEGFLTYYEICENIASKGWTEVWDDDIKAPYAYGTDDGLDQWIGYDNPASIEYKVRMAKDYDLGAIMWWSIDNDDFKGQFCGQGPYPLLNASKREWNRPGGNGDSNPTQGPTNGPTSAHTTKPVTTKVTTTKPPQNGCTDNVLYPHADSCQKYYQCANSQLIENSCASGLYFSTAGYCDWESNVDCCNGQRPCNN